MWKKGKSNQESNCCWKCTKKLEVGEECYINWKINNTSFCCIKCYELKTKQKASECFSELRQLWDDLESKVKNEDLEVKDVKRIYGLKNKITDLFKTEEIKEFGLAYWEVEVDFDNLKNP